jgi:hypothetical protein
VWMANFYTPNEFEAMWSYRKPDGAELARACLGELASLLKLTDRELGGDCCVCLVGLDDGEGLCVAPFICSCHTRWR